MNNQDLAQLESCQARPAPSRLSRRAFVRAAAALGLVAGATPLLAACAPAVRPVGQAQAPALPTPTAAAQPATGAGTTGAGTTGAGTTGATAPAASAAGRSRVVLVRTDDRAAGTRRAIELFGLPALAGKQVLVKPNFNSADPAPGSTHADVLRALVEQVQAQAPAKVTVADRSGMGATRRVMEGVGATALAEELGFDLVALDEDLGADDWVRVQTPGHHWQQGFLLPRLVQEADVMLMACCLKTHRFGGHFTLSLKNGVGLAAKQAPGEGYNYMGELHSSPLQRTLIAEINSAFTPDLIVMDGVEAFVRGGPDRGDLVAPHVVLAGSDRVALDAVGVAILRHYGTTEQVSAGPVFAQEQLARAVALGLGAAGPDAIEFVTEDEDGAALAAVLDQLLRDPA